jgi:membrane-associated protease RseP (regulator of RpoE activity)
MSAADRRRFFAKASIILAGIILLIAVKPKVAGTVGIFVAIIVMIMLHELGHFVMAKRAGMKVTEFFLGFGPKLWSIQRGETEYGVKAIPAGGYVRIIGMNNLEEVDPADEERTYRAKPYRHRLGVAVAGSAMHFILASIILFLIFGFVGVPDGAKPVVREVVADSPAEAAGFEKGDKLLAIDGTAIEQWDDVPNYVQSHGGSEMVFTISRDGKEREISVTPQLAQTTDGDKVPRVGIAPQEAYDKEPILKAAGRSVTEMPEFMWLTVKALGNVFSPSGLENYGNLLTGEGGDDNGRFLSPVGVGGVAGDAVERGWFDVLMFLASINVFVGIFNMVPLLPLDGGHVAIATYEKIASTVKRRRVQVDVGKLMPITMAVVGILVIIGISAIYLDIVDPVQAP